MTREKFLLLVFCGIALLGSLTQTNQSVSAQEVVVITPSEIIDAVNGLRLAYGIPPLAVHSVLMQIGQTEADGIAAGYGGHWRPNGLSLGRWLISLGYPLSGDLTLDGYRSENWWPCNGFTSQDLVEAWMGDDPHSNTMLSTNRSDIGAGVAVSADGEVFCVLETALRTNTGKQQSNAYDILTGIPPEQSANSNGATTQSASSSDSEYIFPVHVSTALPSGDVVHTVEFGQSLWSIAINYHTTIKNIQALNNLGEDFVVYQGQKLLVLKGATQPPPSTPIASPLGTPVPVFSGTPQPTATFAMPTIPFPTTETLPPIGQVEDVNYSGQSSSKPLVVVLILAAFVGGGMGVWLIRDPKS
jgi:LysM repeat protein